MIAALAFTAAFVAMEAVTYVVHRWVMHGPGMVWHRSHHGPRSTGFERNDLFPLAFSTVGIGAFALAAAGIVPGWVWWLGAGVTAYGACYLVVHELFIHRRLPVGMPDVRYLRWLRDRHRTHHRHGGEPYGMLLPLSTRAERGSARSAGG